MPITTNNASVQLQTGEVQNIGNTMLNTSGSILTIVFQFLPAILIFVVSLMLIRIITKGIGFNKSQQNVGTNNKKIFSSRSGF